MIWLLMTSPTVRRLWHTVASFSVDWHGGLPVGALYNSIHESIALIYRGYLTAVKKEKEKRERETRASLMWRSM